MCHLAPYDILQFRFFTSLYVALEAWHCLVDECCTMKSYYENPSRVAFCQLSKLASSRMVRLRLTLTLTAAPSAAKKAAQQLYRSTSILKFQLC